MNTHGYSSLDPLDGRIWIRNLAIPIGKQWVQAYVEAALAHALADFGVCSRKVAE